MARVVAVTGAYGFAGAELVRRLEADASVERVVALDLRRPPLESSKLAFHELDLTMPAADVTLARVLADEKVDALVHAALLPNPTHRTDWAHELESVGTNHVLAAAGGAGVRKLVLHSTTLVYGAHAANPNWLTETHPRRGLGGSRFVSDKLDAEEQFHRFAAENGDRVVTVVRAAATLGPRGVNFATRFFARPVCPVLMGHDPLLQFVHEDDVTDALARAVRIDAPGDYNVVGDGVLPYSAVLRWLGRIPVPLPRRMMRTVSSTLWRTQLFDTPPALLDYLRYVCVCDGTRARDALGFTPRHDIRSTLDSFLGISRWSA